MYPARAGTVTDFSWGLSVGFSFAIGQLEFEDSQIVDDFDF